MDFLRMEGEQNFLFFLPERDRIPLRNFWYRGATQDTKNHVMSESVAYSQQTDIQYHTDNPKQELLSILQQRQPGGEAAQYQPADPRFTKLQTLQGTPFSLMPEVAFVEVLGEGDSISVFTILHNDSYSNNAQIFEDQKRRIPQEDYLTVVKGFIGAYPNVFFQLSDQNLEDFVQTIMSMRNAADYANLVTVFGVRRTNVPLFWPLSDRLNAHYKENRPIEAGLFDLNRYENR
jgi:hypothetical protein